MRPASGRTRWIWRSRSVPAGPRGHGALGGEVLPGSESPVLAEFGNSVTVAVRNALLADSHPAAVQPYLGLTPYDMDLLGNTRGR